MSPEIKKRKVVLASVLKPVDDTRMAEKLAATLLATGEFDVTIIGYPSVNPLVQATIKTLPLTAFKRLSWKRLITPWYVFTKINQVKPDTIIINTPELLLIGVLSKVFFRRRLVYDVLENYYRNIRYTPVYPAPVRLLLAAFTRMVERCLTPFADVILLAEQGYLHELPFGKKGIVLENKLPQSIAQQFKSANPSRFNLLFTGTLAPASGVFEAITLCKALHAIDSHYTLTIIGYCALPDVLAQLKSQLLDCPFITLHGGDQLVPHHEILKAIQSAGGGIIIYPPNPATENSIPTKVYEYMACNLPVMIAHTQPSEALVEACRAGIALPTPVSYTDLHTCWINAVFDFQLPETVFWENEGKKLAEHLNILK